MLQRLVIEHFRNYERAELHLSPGVNVLLGANGQGKTNILEAVCYLSLLRSFRTIHPEMMLQFGQNCFSLYGELKGADGAVHRIGVAYGAQRRLAVDGIPVSRASEFISRLVCTAFTPGDLSLIKGPPGERRRFLNIALSQISGEYLTVLQGYIDALRSRNAMLKQPDKYPRETLTAWDSVLCDRGAKMELARAQFATRLNDELGTLSELFFPDGRKLSVSFLSGITYLPAQVHGSFEEVKQNFSNGLKQSYERDCRERSTRLGPHHSEMACLLNGRLLAHFGSEGECRTAAIAIKLALLEVLRQSRGDSEITMIVDDVLGELDEARRKIFLARIAAAGQVILAGTELPPGLPANTRIFRVSGGRISL